MSTQTGIRANDALLDFFGKCRDGRFRMIKVVIEKEALTLDSHFETQGTWQSDWDKLVLPSVEDIIPCYLLYRLDEKSGATYRWILISWSPDSASVRHKMLYASTKATLKKEFGAGQIKDDLYGNAKEDISFDGYNKHILSAAAPGPLSREELEREEIKQAQNDVAVGVDSKHKTMTGILFPMSREVENAVDEMIARRLEYIQMSIDVSKEIINLEEKGRCSIRELGKKVPTESPRYHLFIFRHTHEGDLFNSVVFIYTMPGYKCSIKERMLYASCSKGVVDRLEQQGLAIEKKIEVDSGDELTEEFLYEEIHPTKNLHRPKFAKPLPPNRGNRRMIRQPVP